MGRFISDSLFKFTDLLFSGEPSEQFVDDPRVGALTGGICGRLSPRVAPRANPNDVDSDRCPLAASGIVAWTVLLLMVSISIRSVFDVTHSPFPCLSSSLDDTSECY